MIRAWRLLAALALIAAALGCGWSMAEEKAHAQGSNDGRLQLHAELSLHTDSGTYAYAHVDAICDTGNGTLLYVVKQNGQERGSVAMLPGGCQKAQAER